MEISDILIDSILYPTKSIKSSWIFMVSAIFMGMLTVVAFNLESFEISANNWIKLLLIAGVLLISLVLFLLTQGYSLDILKESIYQSGNTPNFKFSNQLKNSRKILVVNIFYFIVPTLLSFFLGVILQLWIMPILGLIISIIFFLATTMAECRLAKTGKLINALNVFGTLNDMHTIGFEKVLLTTLTVFSVIIISLLVVLTILWYLDSNVITSIVISIFGVYMLFFSKRAMGLLYSER